MADTGSKLRLSFQTKVLLPVLAALVLLPAVTFWLVNRYITQQVDVGARQTLTASEEVFFRLLDQRNRSLLSAYRNLSSDARVRGSASTGDALTLTRAFEDLMRELHDDNAALLFTNERGIRLVAKSNDPTQNVGELEHAAMPIIQKALEGDLGAGTISIGGRTFNVISIPIYIPSGGFLGAFTVATRINDSIIARDLKPLPFTDVLFVSGQQATASTIRQPELIDSLLRQILVPSSDQKGAQRMMPVIVQGEHFLALTDVYEQTGPNQGFRYILLSSYQQRLDELSHTRSLLMFVSIAGVVLSALVVWFLIQRITQPLRELRDSAEAVGRGDFSRRIAHFANDETGELAQAFNQMTANLQKSLADLEKTVGTLKATQAQLIQSEKLSAVGQFVAGIAHELNNPLTTVIGFSELLEQNDTLDPKTRTQLGYIGKSAMRCHKIVHSLLGFSRQHEPENRLLSLHEVVDAVLEIVAYDMRTNNVEIVRQYETELPPVRGDAHQLQQVILNIVSNARQAIEAFRRDGKITMITSHDATHVILRIKDNGPGIRKENLTRIFDPFFTTKPQGKGTGLGLSLTYGIIQEHHGRIRVESEPGDGAEFIIELPIADPNFKENKAARAVSARPWPTGLRVLAVDDEESILQLVKDVLQNDGHSVDLANGGVMAHEMIAKNNYDVIVSDWKMPGLNGMQLFEDLQVKNPTAANRMLFMTGDVIKETFQEFLKKHDRMCLPKPFSVREFQAAVSKLASANVSGPESNGTAAS